LFRPTLNRCTVGPGAEVIRKAELKDAQSVARILAVAMAKDPVTVWILHRREERLATMASGSPTSSRPSWGRHQTMPRTSLFMRHALNLTSHSV
jgi:hypothetical protein